ncbi:MAG: hypothetical protein AAGJ40_12800 [Planctomycetota bacterium]
MPRLAVGTANYLKYIDARPDMDFNFFAWLRDSVRQSVLLGVSDAVEQIGTPDKDAKIHPEMAALLQATPGNGKPKGRRSGNASGRKRLGKSLQEMNES